jgi:hypothetical protein
MNRASQNWIIRSLLIAAPAAAMASAAVAFHDPADPPPLDPIVAYGEEGDCTLDSWAGHSRCIKFLKQLEAWKVREAAREKTAEEEAKRAQSAPAPGQRTEEQFDALQKQLERIAGQGSRDTTLPRIATFAPKWVEVGDDKRITGLVGDDGSPPRLKVNGESAPLFRPRTGDKQVAKHTLAFNIPVDTAETGEREYLFEACDAAGNCVAEVVKVTVGDAVVDQPNSGSRNYALVIGNDSYDHLPDLKTAVKDASAVAEALIGRYAFDRDRVRLLTNASRGSTLRALSELRRELSADDRLLLYYAGHGQIDAVTNEGFWQPTDAVPDEELVVADSCFSGSLTRSAPDLTSIPKDRFFTEIDSNVSRKVISSGGTEPVADAGSGGHSVFAYYFLKALQANDRPYVTAFELFNGLARAVTNNSNQKPEFGTVSGSGDEGGGDFTFILKSGG